MIPLQVKIKNFLSYGPDLLTIPFDPHHLICLTGKNGHGKSALLDAMTWALWGQARKTAGNTKADSGLLRLGQSEMMVIIDFMCNGSRYRIKREFIQGKIKTQQYLEFGLYDEQSDYLKPLTDKTIRTTQATINRVVGLDYETFINSAFIRQGQSNEFSTKSPKERKEILGAILGLDRFEKIRKLVLDEQRAITQKKEQAKNNLVRLESELFQQEKLNTDLQELKIASREIEDREKQIEKKTFELNNNKQRLAEQQQELSIIQIQHDHLEKKKHEAQEELKKKIQHWRTINLKKWQVEDKKKLEQEKKILAAQQAKLHQLQQDRISSKEKLYCLKSEEQSIITQEEKLIYEKLSLLTLSLQQLTNEKNIYTKQLDQLIEVEKKLLEELKFTCSSEEIVENIAKLEQQFENKQATLIRLQTRYERIRKELAKSQQKQTLIQANESICPLCEQSLNLDHKTILQAKFENQKNLHQHQEKKLQIILEKAPEFLEKDREIIANLKTILEQQQKLKELLDQKIEMQSCIMKLSNKIDEIFKKKMQWEEELATWKTRHIQLQELQKNIKEISYALENNDFDEYKLITLSKQIDSIDRKLEEQEALYDEIKQQPAHKTRIHELCALLRQLEKESAPLKEKLKINAQIQQKKSAIFEQDQYLAHESTMLLKERNLHLEKKGRLEQLQAHLAKQAEEHDKIKKEIGLFEKQITEHQIIATAMSKDGIQALLIEEALPEIEDEANRLLSRLTDNTQHIFIESLKDLKSGATKETMDIKISDSMGIRPYELFSGGEAFRIDFALRIAISKLLARRAGTALQTLIIDEGFGSQDEEGLAHIMDALHRIQDDFAKIIVVSHLPTMQHQFPAQFYVSKGASGSSIEIIEQG